MQYSAYYTYVHNKLTLSKHQDDYYYYYYYYLFIFITLRTALNCSADSSIRVFFSMPIVI